MSYRVRVRVRIGSRIRRRGPKLGFQQAIRTKISSFVEYSVTKNGGEAEIHMRMTKG